MGKCGFEQTIEAYHDEELDSVGRAAVESHLSECGDCLRSLLQLQAMSRLMTSSDQPRLSEISRHRLHLKVDAAMEQGLVRFAWWMSGIAASVLLIGSAWLVKVNDFTLAEAPASAPPWISVALADSRDPVVHDAASPAAQWYLADTSENDN